MADIVKINKKGLMVLDKNFMGQYLECKQYVEQFNMMDKMLKESIKEKMIANDIKQVRTDDYLITLRNGSYQKRYDKDKINKLCEELGITDEKEIDRRTKKEIEVSASVTIKELHG